MELVTKEQAQDVDRLILDPSRLEAFAFLKHEVRRFYPVAHLAAAYQYAARYVEERGRIMTFSYDKLDFHRAIVGFAGIFAGYIRETPALAGAADKLIETDWYE